MKPATMILAGACAWTGLALSPQRATADPVTLTFKSLQRPPNDFVATAFPGAELRVDVFDATNTNNLIPITGFQNLAVPAGSRTFQFNVPASREIQALAVRVRHVNAAAIGGTQLQTVNLIGVFNTTQDVFVVMPQQANVWRPAPWCARPLVRPVRRCFWFPSR